MLGMQSFPPVQPPLLPMLEGLNTEQHAAVTLAPNAHALILAGAGSGKTRVLTTRIAYLLHTGQVSPGGVLAVTFTNKAAREMQARLSAMLPVNTRAMWIGTFHGICNRFLRAHHQLAGLPSMFQILDTQDQLSAIKRLLKANGIDPERQPPKELQWFIGGCKEDGLRPEHIEVRDADTRRKVELYQLYQAQCQREGVVDFGELMLRVFELLRDHEELRTHYQRRFQHILVDEFQDTNKLQYAWLKLLAGQSNALFAVGDDDQSIYAFRGARVDNMQDFVAEFDIAEPIKLEENYRSVSNILDAANALIGHNRHRLGKNLHTQAGAGEPVRVLEAGTDLLEAQWVVDELRALSGEGLRRDAMAVLYRSNAQSRVIETALFNAGVPYRVYGGLRFFERAEIKHALAYLRLLENPHDDTSWSRVVNFPARGIGARSLEQLQDAAKAHGCSLHDATDAVPGKAGANLRAFVALLDVMREAMANQSLSQTIAHVLEHSGLLAHYRGEREGQERVENLQELVTAAESFVTQEGFGLDAPASEVPVAVAPEGEAAGGEATGEVMSPLVAFLTHAALEAGDNQAQAGEDAVQLMTVHAAKGLEFDAVFITGLEEGLFPHENALSDFDGLEEERRLMYVAITRARRRLYLSHTQQRMLHGQTRYHLRSRFLDEVPEEVLKFLTPRGQVAGGESARPWGAAGANIAPSWSAQWQAQPDPQQAADAPAGPVLKAGMRVFHNKFGEGDIRRIEGKDAQARAEVAFARHGVKWLALAVAKLTPIE